jgi:Xaa-Pro aminopeptidase
VNAAPTLDALPPVDVAARLGRLREQLVGAGVEALLVTRLPNVRYLTGFSGSAGMVLVGEDAAWFVTDGRYAEQSQDQLGAAGVDATIEIAPTQADQRGVLAAAAPSWSRIGLEAHGVTWAQQRSYAEWFDGAELIPTEHLVEGLRAVKGSGEVARIHVACAIADAALGDVLPRLHEGITERAFALALELAMRERGASGTSFDTIVASGPNGSKPHARPTDRSIEPNELVVIDFGCIVDGYCSDMTRTVSAGAPTAEAQHVWDVVAASQQAGRDAVRAGVACRAVDAASRAVIDDAGWGASFAHGTGHGVGLEIHEAPRVASTADGTLEPGNVVTVEPGVYLPGIGGVRIEDTVVVTEAGADALTAFPKQLVI